MDSKNKTVAERLRGASEKNPGMPWCKIQKELGISCGDFKGCEGCHQAMHNALADMIEAEQAELRKQNGVDVDALLKLADEIERPCTDIRMLLANDVFAKWASTIRNAVEGATFEQAKPQLPEGIEWPRFEDGELVKLGDHFDHTEGYRNIPVEGIEFRANGWVEVFQKDGICEPLRPGERLKRPEPEVLDADGVPIKVGDTVYTAKGEELTVRKIDASDEQELLVWCGGYRNGFKVYKIANQLTHRKPDTLESVVSEMLADFDGSDSIEIDGYFDRLRKLMGGE